MAVDAWNVSREELVAQRDAIVPLGGKMGTAWDIANAALFLTSDEASFITGIAYENLTIYLGDPVLMVE